MSAANDGADIDNNIMTAAKSLDFGAVFMARQIIGFPFS